MAHYEIIAANALTSPASLLTCGIFDIYPAIVVSCYIPSYSSSGTALIQFNADTGTNYSYSASENLAAVTQANAQAGIPVSNTANLPISAFQMPVQNIAALTKGMWWHGTSGLLSSANPIMLLGAGVWGNNSLPITQVQLNSGGVNMNAGTRLTIIGISP
jgi:hypothetical protein